MCGMRTGAEHRRFPHVPDLSGDEISETELLCESCRRTGEEPILDMPTMPPVAS